MSSIVRYVTINESEEEQTLAASCCKDYKFNCPICDIKGNLKVDNLNDKLTIEHKCDCSFTVRKGSLGGFVIMAVKPIEGAPA